MIDQLNANQKVGQLWIKINNENKFDDELIIKMFNKYNNLYNIYIHDDLD